MLYHMSSASLLMVTCFGQEGGPGIVIFRHDQAGANYARIGEVTEGVTSCLHAATDPHHRFLYVADAIDDCDGVEGGAVAAYRIDAVAGTIEYLNRRPAGGDAPCFLSVSADGRFVLVANYGGGRVTVLPVQENGSLGDAVAHFQPKVPAGREKANAHCVLFDPYDRTVYSTDLGLDRIFVHTFNNKTGALETAFPPAVETVTGAGPRHLAFHPDGSPLYCMTEYDNTLLVLGADPQTMSTTPNQAETTLPAGVDMVTYGADVRIHKNGRFLYSTNRGHDSVAIFAIDKPDGRIRPIGHVASGGSFPWALSLDPASKVLLVANQKSDRINLFSIQDDGATLAATDTTLEVEKPVSFTWIPVNP